MNRDKVWDVLVQQRESCDGHTKVILNEIFSSWVPYLKHLASDHIDGDYKNMTEEQEQETKSVRPHNKLCEELFGHLDHSVKMRPNALPLCHEAVIDSRGTLISDTEQF